MKVNSIEKRDITFAGFLNNKILKKGLEFAAEEGALFAATTTLALSTTARPVAILATPNTDKKTKQVACAKAISSTACGYLMTLALSRPLSNSIKKINNDPARFLDRSTLSNLKDARKKLTESRAYLMATQLFKLGLGFLVAAPKAILTALGTPYILEIFEPEIPPRENLSKINNTKPSENIVFKQKNRLASSIGKILDNNKLQGFVNKYKDSNFPMHIVAATDTLSTVTFVHQTAKNKKLEEKDKIPLIYNSIISTVLSISSTYLIDNLTKNSTEKLIKKFETANKHDPKLAKYVEGIKIAKPVLIAGCVYYIVIPILATFLSDKIDKIKNKQI